jgi:hypothetical protein
MFKNLSIKIYLKITKLKITKFSCNGNTTNRKEALLFLPAQDG